MTNVLLILVLVYISLCGYVYVAQSSLVFFPTTTISQTPLDHGISYEDVYIETSDGETIHAWYIPGKNAVKHVLFFHGNGGNVSNRMNTISILKKMGHAILLIDYRGYGKSSGRPSESGTYKDALAAFGYLMAVRNVDSRDIVIYGRSLGGAIAVWLASQTSPGGLIIESTFTRMVDMGKHRYPYLPARLLTRIHYDSLSQIERVKCPVFSAHSRDDKTVPFSMGKTLAYAAPNLVRFVTLTGEHNEAFFEGGESYFRQLDHFIRDSRAP